MSIKTTEGKGAAPKRLHNTFVPPLHTAEAGQTHTVTCGNCGCEYETEDILDCPFHQAPICSLCCSLERSCHDMCKSAEADKQVI